MARQKKKPNARVMELLSELVDGSESPDEVFGPGGLFKQLRKAATEKMLEAELTEHLGYEKQTRPVTTAAIAATAPVRSAS